MTVPPCDRSRDATENNLMRNELVYLVNIETVIGSLMQSLELLSQRIGDRLFGGLIHPGRDGNGNNRSQDVLFPRIAGYV